MSASTPYAGFGPPPDDLDAPNGSPVEVDDTPQDLIDPDDPRLVSEIQDVNTEANSYAPPSTLPDDKYRVKLALVKQKVGSVEREYVTKNHEKNGPYYFASVSGTIISPDKPQYDGMMVYDSWVGTFKDRQGGTKVQTILSLLRDPSGKPYITKETRLKQKEWMDLFVKALAGEPELYARTEWEWGCQACQKEAKGNKDKYRGGITGMFRFPPSKTERGKYDPMIQCPVNKAHGFSRARPRIQEFYALNAAGAPGTK